jgi:hypothetical protein
VTSLAAGRDSAALPACQSLLSRPELRDKARRCSYVTNRQGQREVGSFHFRSFPHRQKTKEAISAHFACGPIFLPQPERVIGICNPPNPSGSTKALGSTQPLAEDFPGGKARPEPKAQNLTPSASRLSKQCGILDVSVPHMHPRPATGVALPLTFRLLENRVLRETWECYEVFFSQY